MAGESAPDLMVVAARNDNSAGDVVASAVNLVSSDP